MEHLSSDMEQQQHVQCRGDKVQEICSKGYNLLSKERILISSALATVTSTTRI
jgi:hypothetical protein